VLPAILPGRAVNRRLGGPAFVRCVHVGPVVIGALPLLQLQGWIDG
jgi:hypothetical protein